MNIQQILLGIVMTILLVISSSYGAPVNGSDTNITTDSNFTNPVTTLTTPITTSNVTITTLTTALITTVTHATTDQITTAIMNTTNPVTTASALTTAVTNTTNPITTATTVTTKTSSTSTRTMSPTPKKPARKFDGLSFIGGMILVGGLIGIIYLVVSYLRRNNQLPYSNLR